MIQYDDADYTYDDEALLYDGIALLEHVTLIVAGADVTDELADAPLSVHVGTHGNSLGTLDAILDTPTVTPAVEEAVDYYAGTDRLYRGTIRTVTAEERQDGSLQVSIGAQDAGPDGSLPSAAPFGVSDNADGVTTQEYVSLSRQTRTTEGGSPKTTYQLVMEVDGLQPNQLVEVTSAALGLAAEELEIVDMVATRLFADQPYYVYTLGDPRVSMAQIVTDFEVADGSITETKISDSAVSTPKLQANAVTAEKVAAGAIETEHFAATATISLLTNSGADVVIDADGINVVDGAIVVENAGGTVIIDGSSNMFKILSTGTMSIANGPNGSGGTTEIITSVTLALGLAYVPAFLGFLESAVNTAIVGNWMDWVRTTGFTDSYGVWEQMACYVNMNGTDTKPVALWRVSDLYNQSAKSAVFRYYVLKEASI